MRTVQQALVIALIMMFAFEAFAAPRLRVGLRYRAPDPAEMAADPLSELSTAPRDVAEVPKVIEVEPVATVQEVERVSRQQEVTRFGTGVFGQSPGITREDGGLRIDTID